MDNITEKQNPKSNRIDEFSVQKILEIINQEDQWLQKTFDWAVL